MEKRTQKVKIQVKQEAYQEYPHHTLQPDQYYHNQPENNNFRYNFSSSTPNFFGYPPPLPFQFPNYQCPLPPDQLFWPQVPLNHFPVLNQASNYPEVKKVEKNPPLYRCPRVKEQDKEDSDYVGEESAESASNLQDINSPENHTNEGYYWTPEENKRYHEFLKNNSQLFDLTLNEKKALKVNVLMSKKIKTRNPQQCHSHHQKMMKKYQGLNNILQNMTFDRKKRESKRKKKNVDSNIILKKERKSKKSLEGE